LPSKFIQPFHCGNADLVAETATGAGISQAPETQCIDRFAMRAFDSFDAGSEFPIIFPA